MGVIAGAFQLYMRFALNGHEEMVDAGGRIDFACATELFLIIFFLCSAASLS